MKVMQLIAGSLLAWFALGATIAGAEHLTLPPDAVSAPTEQPAPPPKRTFDVNVDLKLDADGFRVGGRVVGPQGVWGAWINGRTHPRGFVLDGRVQEPDRATNFKVDADVMEWLLRGWPILLP